MTHGYSNLASLHWRLGVHDVRAIKYQHPWLVVFPTYTVGCWSRAEARRRWKEGA